MKKRIAFESGLHELDKAIGGFRRGSLTVVAGRPAMGTESFVHTLLSNKFIESKGRRRALYGAFFPYFKETEFLMGLDCAHARIGFYDALQWKLLPVGLKKLREVREKYCGQNWREDTLFIGRWPLTSSSLRHLKSCLCTSFKKTTVFFADFSGFWKIGDRRRMLGFWGPLKAVAEEFNIPIIVTCGIPRAVEKKDPPIPSLKDLQVGRFKRYADKILILYRESYYTPNDENRYRANIIIAKNSDGKTGVIDVKYDPGCRRFDDV